jgi:hypothetical protein
MIRRTISGLAASVLSLASVGAGTAGAGTLDSFFDSSRLYLSTSQAAAETCLRAPEIATDIRILNPELTRDKPRDLNGLRTTTGILQGLAHLSYGFEIGFTLERIRSDDGYCIRVSEAKINAGHIPPKIWLKPGISKGSCKYDVTVEHELDHVRNYHEHLQRFDEAVRKELPLMLKGKAYYRISSMSESAVAEERLKAEVMEMVSNLHDRSYDIAEAIDFQMDSPSEYRRLWSLCR